jgi:hypothetical protein
MFINLTPHAIVVRLNDGNGTDVTFPPSGKIARVDELPTQIVGEVDGIPILSRTVFGQVIDLPEPTEGIRYIVSGLVAGVVYRSDVFAPATGPKDGPIRNDKGHIVAVVALKATTNGIDDGVVIC